MSRKKRKNSRIRILDTGDDLEALFTGKQSADTPHELSEILETSLTHDRFQHFLSEKYNSGNSPEKISIHHIIKKYPRPERELDLHRLSASDAEHKARCFIQDAVAAGLKTLRIIVGKGIHSAGMPVLPDCIEALLSELKKSGCVLTFSWEKREKKRSGSIIVYLKHSRDNRGCTS